MKVRENEWNNLYAALDYAYVQLAFFSRQMRVAAKINITNVVAVFTNHLSKCTKIDVTDKRQWLSSQLWQLQRQPVGQICSRQEPVDPYELRRLISWLANPRLAESLG